MTRTSDSSNAERICNTDDLRNERRRRATTPSGAFRTDFSNGAEHVTQTSNSSEFPERTRSATSDDAEQNGFAQKQRCQARVEDEQFGRISKSDALRNERQRRAERFGQTS